MIRLFSTIYAEPDEKRRMEYKRCLELNSSCEPIEEICILSEGGEELLPDSDRIKIRRTRSRPTYQDYFDWISELASDQDISIIANTDIYFDQQLAIFKHSVIPPNTVFALSRWDWKGGAKPEHYDHKDSQDVWVLEGMPPRVFGDFPVGVPRCDNRVAAEFEKAGLKVLNPSFSLRCYHLHDQAPRDYLDPNHSEIIPPPYKYIWPHNLFGPVQTFNHNRKHPGCQLSWRIDWREVRKWLPVRAALRVLRVMRIRFSNQVN